MKKIFKNILILLYGFLVFLDIGFSDTMSTNYKKRIFLVGDSIVAAYSRGLYPLGSWGTFLGHYFDDNVVVLDNAVGGESTKTYINTGKWDDVLGYVEAGDYVLIEFAHNDENATSYTVSNDIYYYDIYANPDTEFQINLTRFVNEIKDKGATPVLVTPTIRVAGYYYIGSWIETHLQETISNGDTNFISTDTTYHSAVRQVASNTSTILIDLNNYTRNFIAALSDTNEIFTYYYFSPSNTYPYYRAGTVDPTHSSQKGAKQWSSFIASELVKNIPELYFYYIPSPEISISITNNYFDTNNILAEYNVPLSTNDWVKGYSNSINLEFTNDILTFSATINTNDLGIYYNLTTSGLNISEYDYLEFYCKVNSQKASSLGDLLGFALYYTPFIIYNAYFGKPSDDWHSVIIPVKDLITMGKVPVNQWSATQLMCIQAETRYFDNGDQFSVSFKKIRFVKTQKQLASASTNVPEIPQNFKIIKIESDKFLLSWDFVTNATKYKLYKSIDGDAYSLCKEIDSAVLSYSENGLNEFTHYYYKLTSYNSYTGKESEGSFADVFIQGTTLNSVKFNIVNKRDKDVIINNLPNGSEFCLYDPKGELLLEMTIKEDNGNGINLLHYKDLKIGLYLMKITYKGQKYFKPIFVY